MTLPAPIRLLGAPGSPYTRKMLAVLRYRRLPYALILGSHRDQTNLPQPKVALLPTFYLPGPDGALEAVVDSTPLIRRLERERAGRAVPPTDEALNFLDELLEDYGDEWLTKAMFHYRWHYQADIDRAAAILPRWRVEPQAEERVAVMSRMFADRQIGRLGYVGSNAVTAPVIEASYRRFLSLFRAHLETHAFAFGARPAAADFAIYGQLTQLTHFDPTPMAEALDHAPRVYAWVDVVDDLSGLEPKPEDWLDPGALPETLRALFGEIGRTYAPVMIANARALMSGADRVEAKVDGLPWTQQPFPYQGRCLAQLRAAHAALSAPARAQVDGFLAGTGCEALFA